MPETKILLGLLHKTLASSGLKVCGFTSPHTTLLTLSLTLRGVLTPYTRPTVTAHDDAFAPPAFLTQKMSNSLPYP